MNKKRYILIAFHPYDEDDEMFGRVISTHKNAELLEKAGDKYKGNLPLTWTLSEEGHRAGDVLRTKDGVFR